MTEHYEDLVYTRGSRIMPWNPYKQMNVYYYLLDGLLIDTGPKNLEHLAAAFFESQQIRQVVLTHNHEDHSGMAAWLQEKKMVPVYLHEHSLEEAREESFLSPYRLEIWGSRRAFSALPLPESIRTEKYEFEVIDTPGHCRYHKVLLLKEKGWLFSGDLLTVLMPTAVFREENLSDLIVSLVRVSKLPFETVFCTHNGILEHGKQLFERKLDYLLGLQEQVRALRAKGLTDSVITRMLFPGCDDPNSFLGLDWTLDFSAYNMIATL